jgi:Delta24-sterol reductase
MTLYEYLFRLDLGGFWIGRYAHSSLTMVRLLLHLGIPKVQSQGTFNPNVLFRLLFGWAFSSQSLYRMWHRIPNSISEQLFFIHDFYTPWSKAKETVADFMEETGIFPIWLCPIKGAGTSQFLAPHYGKGNFLNIGLYGIPKQRPISELTARLEKKILEYGGRKMLYSFTYYDKEMFARMYEEEKYNALRKKYQADYSFPSLYQKVVKSFSSCEKKLW